MTTAPDRPTRFAADLLDSAAVEGARASRSTKQQLDHWARLGRAVDCRTSTATQRIAAAISGDLPLRELTPDEAVIANVTIDVDIAERVRATSYGEQLNREGITTVSLDEDGNLVQRHPDGTTTILSNELTPVTTKPVIREAATA